MKINEKELRKVIKNELLAEAVVTTGGGALDREGAYTQSERQDIGNKVRAEFIKQATSAGVITPEDSWALDLYIGPRNIKISRLQGSLGPPNKPNKKAIKQIARSIANNTSILNRTTLQGFRGLEVAMSNSGSSARAADVKPGGTSRSGGGGGRGGGRGADPCIIKLQKDVNRSLSQDDQFIPLDTDGLLGPKTRSGWAQAGGDVDVLKAYRRGDACPELKRSDMIKNQEGGEKLERMEIHINCKEIENSYRRLNRTHRMWKNLMQTADANPDEYWNLKVPIVGPAGVGGKSAASWRLKEPIIQKSLASLREMVLDCEESQQVDEYGNRKVIYLEDWKGDIDQAISDTRQAQQAMVSFMSSYMDNPSVNRGRFSPGGSGFEELGMPSSPGEDYFRLKKSVIGMVNALSDARRSMKRSLDNMKSVTYDLDVEEEAEVETLAESSAKNIVNFLKVIY